MLALLGQQLEGWTCFLILWGYMWWEWEWEWEREWEGEWSQALEAKLKGLSTLEQQLNSFALTQP